MDYEKKYNDLVNDLKELWNCHTNDSQLLDELAEIFPELAESEDERIRKEIIDFLETLPASELKRIPRPISQWFSWLEKQKEPENVSATTMIPSCWAEEPSLQKEQKPIKTEVYEVGKGTTICGQDYKCKKDYKEGNCQYIKDVIYHCSRDGYLTDQNGISWSCTPEWFKEYIQSNTEWAEEEKTRFVSGQFLQCKLSFDDFKEGEHYWLEYVGDDTYVGRSDNILNQKFHITPRQLYTLFSQQIEETQKEQKPAEPAGKLSREEYLYQLLIDQLITYSDYEYLTGKKPAEWSEEEYGRLFDIEHYLEGTLQLSPDRRIACIDFLKSLRPQPKQKRQIKEGNKVSIHCRKDRKKDIITIYDGKVGEVIHVWDAKRNPWGHIGVRLDNGCNNGFYEDELEVLDEPSWKPREEQMEALEYVIRDYREDSCNATANYLQEILDHLKNM